MGDAAGFARPHVAVAAATVAAVAVLPAAPADVAASIAWIVLAIQVATVVVLLFTQRTRSVSRRSVLPE